MKRLFSFIYFLFNLFHFYNIYELIYFDKWCFFCSGNLISWSGSLCKTSLFLRYSWALFFFTIVFNLLWSISICIQLGRHLSYSILPILFRMRIPAGIHSSLRQSLFYRWFIISSSRPFSSLTYGPYSVQIYFTTRISSIHLLDIFCIKTITGYAILILFQFCGTFCTNRL